MKPFRTAFKSPWQNGMAERFVGSCRRDLFDRVPSPSLRGRDSIPILAYRLQEQARMAEIRNRKAPPRVHKTWKQPQSEFPASTQDRHALRL